MNKKISSTNTNEIFFNLAQKDEQIEELQMKLIEATKELEKSTELLEKVANEQSKTKSPEKESDIVNDLKAQLATSHERCQELQELASSAEQDAQNQGQQVTIH